MLHAVGDERGAGPGCCLSSDEIEAALRWIDEFGDLDGGRLLEYRRRSAGGTGDPNRPFLRIFEGMLDAASALPDYRLPEVFAGFSRADYEDPVPYPVACSPQAWAAGALPSMLIAGLGITADGLRHTLRVRRPSLPRHVNQVAVKRLRVGDALVDLVFERVTDRSDSVALTDVRIDGQLDVVLEIPRAETNV